VPLVRIKPQRLFDVLKHFVLHEVPMKLLQCNMTRAMDRDCATSVCDGHRCARHRMHRARQSIARCAVLGFEKLAKRQRLDHAQVVDTE
jgi:hypothetical protein